MIAWGRIAVAVLVLLGTADAAVAKDEELRRILIEKGVLDEEEAAGMASDNGGSDGGRTEMGTFYDEGFLVFASEDEQFKWWIDGRIQIDAAGYQSSTNPLSSGVELRRARLGVKAILWKDWAGELDIDFADNDPEIKDAWIAYNGLTQRLPEGVNAKVKFGSFKEPFSLEEVTSSRQIAFMERSLANVFAPGRHLGTALTFWGANWRLSAGLFGQEVGDEDEGADISGDEAWGSSARLTAVPFQNEGTLLHVGASAMVREPDADDKLSETLRFRVRPETHVERERFLSTGKFTNNRRYHAFGGEVALLRGPFMVQGEYIQTQVDRLSGTDDASFGGWYVHASWVVTGEARTYLPEFGEFSQIVPKGENGALEFAIRYSAADLTDFSSKIFGGSQRNFTVGGNWYLNRNLRLSLNYVHVNSDKFADADGAFLGNDDFSVIQGRMQLAF